MATINADGSPADGSMRTRRLIPWPISIARTGDIIIHRKEAHIVASFVVRYGLAAIYGAACAIVIGNYCRSTVTLAASVSASTVSRSTFSEKRAAEVISNGKVSTEGSGLHTMFKQFLEGRLTEMPDETRSVSIDENGTMLFRVGIGQHSPNVTARLDLSEVLAALKQQINGPASNTNTDTP